MNEETFANFTYRPNMGDISKY